MAPRRDEAPRLAEARDELRQLGYLTHRLDRFLLQDAVRAAPPWRAAVSAAWRVGLLSGVVLAVANAVVLAAANGALARAPFDLLPLFLHLLAPMALGAALGFAALAGGVALFLRLVPPRRIEAFAFGAAGATTAALAGAGLWIGRGLWQLVPPWQLAVAALAAAAVGWALTRLFEAAYLALAIRFTRLLPASRRFGRRALAVGLAALAALVLLPVLVSARGAAPPSPPVLPTAPGERALLVGVDGVLAEEFDYLLARGELREVARLASAGRLARYRRPEEAPASFWTTIATGLPTARHGIVAMDSFRPAGMSTALARNGPWRLWWSGIAQPLGLAEHRPLLAGRRLAPTLWELAARGGEPVLAVNWWATYPAPKLAGLVVAHGAYQLLAAGAPGAVAPETRVQEITARRAPETEGTTGAAGDLAERALLPDRFYRDLFAAELPAAPRAAALYLPAADIAAEGWHGTGLAFADLVRAELREADALLALAAPQFATVALVVDPGRRGGEEGRLLLWRASGCAAADERPSLGASAAPESVAPEAIAAALLRALGLPQSDELPAPPLCAWPPPPARVATFGEPAAAAPSPAASEEYLQSLRSLGYL